MTTLKTTTRLMTSAGLKTALVAGLAASLCFPAAAASNGQDLTVEFTYNPANPVAETYDAFEQTARNACRPNENAVRGTQIFRYSRACEQDLVEKAVYATGFEALIEHHSSETGARRPTPTLTSR